MRNERSFRFLMITVIVLLVANLLVSINGTNSRTARADGIPDQGAQLNSVISQLQDLNKKVGGLQDYLQSGNLSVKTPDMVKKDK